MNIQSIIFIILIIICVLDGILNVAYICVSECNAYNKKKEQEKKSNYDSMFTFNIDHSSELTTSEAETILKIARRLEISPETGDIIGFFVYPYEATEVKLLNCDDLKQASRS